MAERGNTTTRVNLRSNPGTDQPSLTVLDAGVPVNILAQSGDWLQVEVSGKTGFVLDRFVARQQNAVPAGLVASPAGEPLADTDLSPSQDQLLKLGKKATNSEKLVAITWNRAGGLLNALAGHLKLDPGAAVAVFGTEAGGNGFNPDGRMKIRFENHHFHRHWGQAHSDKFQEHFRFNSVRPWTGHQFRPSPQGDFQDVHGSQAMEWDVFEFAAGLDDTAAKLSISMGGPQIMGANFAEAGFESVQQMFDAFTKSEKRQIVAFFDFLQGPETHPRKVLALQRKDFVTFASLYNGPGQAAEYGARIAGLFDTFQRMRAA